MFFSYILRVYILCIYYLCSKNVQSFETNQTIEAFDKATGKFSNQTYNVVEDVKYLPPSFVEAFYNNKTGRLGVPIIEELIISSNNFTIDWMDPSEADDVIITTYNVTISFEGLLWDIPDNCNLILDDIDNITNYVVNDTEITFPNALPYAKYVVNITGNTEKQGLTDTLTVPFHTSEAQPNGVSFIDEQFTTVNITEDSYLVIANVTCNANCFNGQFYGYEILWEGTRRGYPNDTYRESIDFTDSCTTSHRLLPEYEYKITVKTSNTNNEIINEYNKILSPPGAPIYDTTFLFKTMNIKDTTVTLTLRKKDFNNKYGELQYMAIILTYTYEKPRLEQWGFIEWPYIENDTDLLFQATPKFWNPFINSSFTIFTVGTDHDCSGFYCNKPLEPNRTYGILLKTFNRLYVLTDNEIIFTTKTKIDRTNYVAISVSLTIIIPFILFIIICILTRRRKRINVMSWSSLDIPVSTFIEYCNTLEYTPPQLPQQELRDEWDRLQDESKLIYEDTPVHFARLDENKERNRYVNIFANDETRVKLNNPNGENNDDYINASYIKGYNGQRQYIAAQAPLSNTCKDFWKMIIAEKVSIIVMLVQFVEGDKEKCHKYFPDRQMKSMLIDDEMFVECFSELCYGYYYVRKLRVTTGELNKIVTHLQYIAWPDFGVPQSTEAVLDFFMAFNSTWNSATLALVHCSAGVGRTGTFIATNILMGKLKIDGARKINVYKTVLDLRKQRMNMVQTMNQYLYIYILIRGFLLEPWRKARIPINSDSSTQSTEVLVADDSTSDEMEGACALPITETPL